MGVRERLSTHASLATVDGDAASRGRPSDLAVPFVRWSHWADPASPSRKRINRLRRAFRSRRRLVESVGCPRASTRSDSGERAEGSDHGGRHLEQVAPGRRGAVEVIGNRPPSRPDAVPLSLRPRQQACVDPRSALSQIVCSNTGFRHFCFTGRAARRVAANRGPMRDRKSGCCSAWRFRTAVWTVVLARSALARSSMRCQVAPRCLWARSDFRSLLRSRARPAAIRDALNSRVSQFGYGLGAVRMRCRCQCSLFAGRGAVG